MFLCLLVLGYEVLVGRNHALVMCVPQFLAYGRDSINSLKGGMKALLVGTLAKSPLGLPLMTGMIKGKLRVSYVVWVLNNE